MRKTHVLLLALLVVAASCSGEPARKILGSWKEITGEEQLSFYPDGNVVLTNRAASIACTYQVTREGSLKLATDGTPRRKRGDRDESNHAAAAGTPYLIVWCGSF